MFWTVFLSIIRSLRRYIHHQVYVIQVLWLLASENEKFLRTVFPSIIRSLRLYIQHQVYVIQVLWLLAIGNEKELLIPNSKQPQNLDDIYLMYVQP